MNYFDDNGRPTVTFDKMLARLRFIEVQMQADGMLKELDELRSLVAAVIDILLADSDIDHPDDIHIGATTDLLDTDP